MNHIINQLKTQMQIKHPTIVEIGCCDGEDSLAFLSAFGNKMKLYCFEADPRNIVIFRENIKDSDRCKLVPMAISNEDGEVTFYQSFGKRPGNPSQVNRRSSGSIRKPDGHLQAQKWCSFNDGIKVPSITLDSWCKQNGITSIDLIWADVNGGERNMIEGAKNALKFTKYIYTEFGPTKQEAQKWFGLDVDVDFKLFEGGITREEILTMLPDFEEIAVINNNVFMKNRSLV